jgi:hypothetical protein
VNYYEDEAMFLLDLTAAQEAEVVVTLNPNTPSETVVTGESCRRVQLVATRSASP